MEDVQSNPYYSPDVVQAVALPDHHVKAYFDDGAIRVFDVNPMIALGGVFAPLLDERVFAETLTVLNQTVAWTLDHSYDERECAVDLAPDVLYHEGEKATE